MVADSVCIFIATSYHKVSFCTFICCVWTLYFDCAHHTVTGISCFHQGDDSSQVRLLENLCTHASTTMVLCNSRNNGSCLESECMLVMHGVHRVSGSTISLHIAKDTGSRELHLTQLEALMQLQQQPEGTQGTTPSPFHLMGACYP